MLNPLWTLSGLARREVFTPVVFDPSMLEVVNSHVVIKACLSRDIELEGQRGFWFWLMPRLSDFATSASQTLVNLMARFWQHNRQVFVEI